MRIISNIHKLSLVWLIPSSIFDSFDVLSNYGEKNIPYHDIIVTSLSAGLLCTMVGITDFFTDNVSLVISWLVFVFIVSYNKCNNLIWVYRVKNQWSNGVRGLGKIIQIFTMNEGNVALASGQWIPSVDQNRKFSHRFTSIINSIELLSNYKHTFRILMVT